jgi:hypothetical protein
MGEHHRHRAPHAHTRQEAHSRQPLPAAAGRGEQSKDGVEAHGGDQGPFAACGCKGVTGALRVTLAQGMSACVLCWQCADAEVLGRAQQAYVARATEGRRTCAVSQDAPHQGTSQHAHEHHLPACSIVTLDSEHSANMLVLSLISYGTRASAEAVHDAVAVSSTLHVPMPERPCCWHQDAGHRPPPAAPAQSTGFPPHPTRLLSRRRGASAIEIVPHQPVARVNLRVCQSRREEATLATRHTSSASSKSTHSCPSSGMLQPETEGLPQARLHDEQKPQLHR